jgi:hypothetical protein
MVMGPTPPGTGVIAPATVAASPASEFNSAYTALNLDKCAHTASSEPEDYGFWRCPGYAGIAVRVSAGDQRMFVSFGLGADRQPAAQQTLPNFNSVDKTRIEWRLRIEKRPRARKIEPIATIARWRVQISEAEGTLSGQVLVVTRLGDAVCHIGYVDASANADANALARELADTRARDFDCQNDVRIIAGKRGKSVDAIASVIAHQAKNKVESK